MPFQVIPIRNKHNVNFTMFEADRIPGQWARYSARHDLVLVPTDPCRRAWQQSGLPGDKIRICPPAAFHTGPPKVRSHVYPDLKVRFLNIAYYIPRKNLLNLLKVWILATQPGDDAVLILKISCFPEKRVKMLHKNIQQVQKSVGKTWRECAPVVLRVNEYLTDAEMAGLFLSATHYWSMSRGEGWDLAMFQAAAAGLYLPAPEHTAYTVYLDRSIARFIPVVKFRPRLNHMTVHINFSGTQCGGNRMWTWHCISSAKPWTIIRVERISWPNIK